MKNRTCAFTGHRPHNFPWKYNENDSRCEALKQVLSEQISLLANSGFNQFLSGMAEGADMWAALSILSLRENNPSIKLHCILPCTTQANNWSAPAQNLYHTILQQADSIIYVRRDYQTNCMLERNHFLVEHSSSLLSIYNGEPRGGTAATIRYARKLGRGITVINPTTLQISRESPATPP